jgi:hypothetical protein
VTFIENWLKDQGIKAKPKVYQERGSGTSRKRKVLLQMLEDLGIDLTADKQKENKNQVIVVRDIQRFTRNGKHYGYFGTPLEEAGIPIISIQENMVSGIEADPDPTSDMMQLIFTTIGGQEVLTRKKQQQAGAGLAEVWDGGFIFMYPHEPNPFRRMLDLMPYWVEEGVRARPNTTDLSPTQVREMLGGKSNDWIQKNRRRLRAIREKTDEKTLKQWLNFVDKMREMEIAHGLGQRPRHYPKSTKVSKRMQAVLRMAMGWIQEPWNVERWGEMPTDEQVQFWFDNYKDFQPRSERT